MPVSCPSFRGQQNSRIDVVVCRHELWFCHLQMRALKLLCLLAHMEHRSRREGAEARVMKMKVVKCLVSVGWRALSKSVRGDCAVDARCFLCSSLLAIHLGFPSGALHSGLPNCAADNPGYCAAAHCSCPQSSEELEATMEELG